MLSPVLERVGRTYDEAVAPVAEFYDELERRTELADDGTVQFDSTDLQDSLGALVSPDETREALRGLELVAQDGAAVLGHHPNGGAPIVMPWRSILVPGFVESLGPSGLDALGVWPGASRDSVRDRLSAFGPIPAWLAEPQALESLVVRRTGMLAWPDATVRRLDLNPDIGGGGVGGLPQPKPGTPKPPPAITAEEIALLSKCLAAMQVRVTFWGLDICWGRDCTAAISAALLGTASEYLAANLPNAIKVALGGAGGAGAVAALGGPVAIALLAAGIVYGAAFAYKAETCRGGVCMRFFWPTPFVLMGIPPAVRCA